MAIIKIENLTAGMTLAGDVCDRKGRVLLPAGVELTDKHLRIFNTWGVVEADIAGGEGNESAPDGFATDVDPLLLAEAEASMNRLFIHCDLENQVIQELRHACLLRKLAHVS